MKKLVCSCAAIILLFGLAGALHAQPNVTYVNTTNDTGGDLTGAALGVNVSGTLMWDYSNGSSTTGTTADREKGDIEGNQRNNLPPTVTFGSGVDLEGASGGWGYQMIIDDFGGPFEMGTLASAIEDNSLSESLALLEISGGVTAMRLGVVMDGLDGIAFVGDDLTVSAGVVGASVDPFANIGDPAALDTDVHWFDVSEISDGDILSIDTNGGTSGLGTVIGFVISNVKGGVLKGDVNQDGSVDLLDVQPFVELVTGGEFQAEADANCDGAVNLLDVTPFVLILTGG